MILLIDNYDSFSYNLYQLIGSSEPDIQVVRNDGISVEEIGAEKPDCLILSPGPGRPADAGICEEAVRPSPERCRFWAYVSDIRLSARPSGRNRLCWQDHARQILCRQH